jgi:ferredoxin
VCLAPTYRLRGDEEDAGVVGDEGGGSAGHRRRVAVSARVAPAPREPRDEPPARDVDTAFEVRLARSGGTLTVPPGRSILAVLKEAGVAVLSNCAEGVCGTCETTVLFGRPDHRDLLLTEAERAASVTMLICVSRCLRGPLVLDL